MVPTAHRTLAVLLALLLIATPATAAVSVGKMAPDMHEQGAEAPYRIDTPNPIPTTSSSEVALSETGPELVSADSLGSLGKNVSSVNALQLRREVANAASGGEADSKLDSKLAAEFNATLSAYRGPNRLSEPTFETDATVVKDLPEAESLKLRTADAKVAKTTLADLKRARERVGARNGTNESRLDRLAEQSRNAWRSAQQADSDVEAIRTYETAWSAANTALQHLDAAHTPEVTLYRADPIRNESRSYPVRGEIFDVTTADLTSATVAVNETGQTIPIETDAIHDQAILVNTSVEIPATPTTITVSVTENGTTYRETLHLDGDRLPDTIEQQAGSDPLDPDSDFAPTDVDESNDGVLDRAENNDGDDLVTAREILVGTNPEANDSDGDGLSDGVEVDIDALDPTEPDTDGDGRSDGVTDLDDDLATNIEEAEAGTDLQTNDTDGDGLHDGFEIADRGGSPLETDPLTADSDGDDLDDGTEMRLDFYGPPFPAERDTDGDGVVDGNETYTTSKTDPETNTTVRVVGTGNAAEHVTLSPAHFADRLTNTSAFFEPIVEIDPAANQSIQNLTVELPVTTETSPDQLAVHHWNSSSDTVWQPRSTNSTGQRARATIDDVGTDANSSVYVALGNVSAVAQQFSATLNTTPASADRGSAGAEAGPNTQRVEAKSHGDCPPSRSPGQPGPISIDSPTTSNCDGSGDNDGGSDGSGDNDGGSDGSGDNGGGSGGSGDNGGNNGDCPPSRTPGQPGPISIDSPTTSNCDDSGDNDGDGGSGDNDGGSGGSGDNGGNDGNCPPTRTPGQPGPVSTDSSTTSNCDGSGDNDGDGGSGDNDGGNNGDCPPSRTPGQPGPVSTESSTTSNCNGSGDGDSEDNDGGNNGDCPPTRTPGQPGPVSTDSPTTNNCGDTGGTGGGSDGNPYVDSDGDGLNDAVESQQWRMPTGETFSTDPNDPDTDGDGIEDGTEVSFVMVDFDSAPTFELSTVVSDPTSTDSDGDTVSDWTEVEELRTDPLDPDSDDDGRPDAEDPQPSTPDSGEDQEQSFHLSGDKPADEFLDGMVYGDWGYVHDRDGSRTAAYLFGWMFPYLAMAVTTVPVIEDAVEVALEVRECLAINDALWENGLDCGFAAWELATSGAKIIGAATSVTGVGIALAGATFAADEAADLGRATTVTATVLKKAPTKSAKPVGRMMTKQFGQTGTTLATKVAGQLSPAKQSALRHGIRQAELENAGLSADAAEQVAKNADDTAKAKSALKRIDVLDEVPAKTRSEIVTSLVKECAGGTAKSYHATATTADISSAGWCIPSDAQIWSLSDGELTKLWNKLDKETFFSFARSDFNKETLRGLAKAHDPAQVYDLMQMMPPKKQDVVVNFVNSLEHDAVWKMFSVPGRNAQDFRKALFVFWRSDEVTTTAINQYVTDVWAIKSLKNDGLVRGPIQVPIDHATTKSGEWKKPHNLEDGAFKKFKGEKMR